MSRVVAIKNVAGTSLGLGRQGAPAGAGAGVLVGDIAGTLATSNRAVLGRAVGLITTTRAVATARSRAALLLQLLDDRVQRGNDFVLFLLHPLATSSQLQTPLDVLHLPRDFRERVLLE